MRTLTPLILLPLVVLAPLLMAPTAYAIEVEPQPTVFVIIQADELVAEVGDSEIRASLTLFAIEAQARAEALLGVDAPMAPPPVVPGGLDRQIAAELLGNLLSHKNLVEFLGAVTRSTDPDMLGTPVAVTADTANSTIVFTFGPILSGRLVGQTFTFKGMGTVLIVCLDCRSD